MQSYLFCFLLGCLLVILSGCSSKPVQQNPGYTGDEKQTIYTTSSTSSNEVHASDIAMEKAIAICKAQDRQVLLVDHTSKYQGLNNGQKKIVGLANQDLNVKASTSSGFDYRGILRFKCIEKQKN